MLVRRVSGRGHILLLGDSPMQTIMLEELAFSELTPVPTVVCLGQGIHDRKQSAGKLRITYIQGDPTDPSALKNAAPDTASAILVNTWGTPDAENRSRKIIQALFESGQSLTPACPVTVINCPGDERVRSVSIEESYSLIVSQIVRHKYMSAVVRELLSFRGNEIYYYPAEALAGFTWAKTLRAFENACPAGIVQDGVLTYNPEQGRVLGPDDTLVVIAGSRAEITLNSAFIPVPNGDGIANDSLPSSPEESILILGWSKICPRILSNLADRCAEESVIRVITRVPLDPMPCALDDRVTITFETGTIESEKYLASIQWQYYENILVAEPEILTTLRGVLAGPGFTCSVTALASEGSTAVSDDPDIVSPDIVFRYITQVLLHPDISLAIHELTRPHSAEVALKPAENYVKIEKDVDFYTILESARRKGETAIGYITETGPTITLNPPKTEKMRFYHFDKIVVLSDKK